MLTEMNSLSENVTETAYLDILNLAEYQEATALAYVQDVRVGITKFDSGFVTFYLRDVNANVITARLFDVADFMMSGVNANAFKGKAVKLTFICQIFNGTKQLVISGTSGIEVYSGEFDYSRFIGEIKCDTSILESVGKSCFGNDWNLLAEYKYFSCDSLGKGRVGAFIKIFDLALSSLSSYTDFDNLDVKELYYTFFSSMQEYFYLLKNKKTYADISSLLIYDVMSKISSKYDGRDEKLLIIDTVRALSGFEKPLGLIPKLIYDAVTMAKKHVDLILVNNTLPIGTSVNVGGDSLLKY